MGKPYFILLLLLLVSCSAEEPLLFPEDRVLAVTVLPHPVEPEAYMRYPFRVRLADSLLYVMDLHATEAYIRQFSYPALALRQTFALRGEAPGYFLNAENIRMDDPSGDVYFLDANKRQLARIDPENGQLRQSTQLPEALIRTLDFVPVSDSVFLVPDYTGKHRVTLVDHQGAILKNLFRIPTDKRDKRAPVVQAQAWRSFLDYNPANGILALATQLGQVIEIYDLQQESIVKIVTGKNGRPQFVEGNGYAVPSGFMGYSDIHVGREHIYAIFWGTTFDDIRQGIVPQEGGNQIHVFDLRGNPVCLYTLDRHITGFCVDEARRKIIALDVNSNQPIIEYDIS